MRCCDVELGDRVLSIWDTMFFKSRFVPIGADLVTALDTYRKARQDLPMPAGGPAEQTPEGVAEAAG